MKYTAAILAACLSSCATAPKVAGEPRKPPHPVVEFLSQFRVEVIAGFNGISAGVRIQPAEKPELEPALPQK